MADDRSDLCSSKRLLSFDSNTGPRALPMDLKCILFDLEFKPAGLQTLAVSGQGIGRPCEVQYHSKGASSLALSILLIWAGGVECDQGQLL